MAKTKADDAAGMKFISLVPLEKPGVIEFRAWEKTQWLYIWQKPWNERTTIPHLVFYDCPTARQVTFRLLILEGQAQMPIDPEGEEWYPLGFGWETRRSFGTLWMSTYCHNKPSEIKRGSMVATEIEPKGRFKPDLLAPMEDEVYAP